MPFKYQPWTTVKSVMKGEKQAFIVSLPNSHCNHSVLFLLLFQGIYLLFIKGYLKIFLFMCLCLVFVWVNASRVCLCPQRPDQEVTPRIGVTGCWEPPGVLSCVWTQVFWKSRKHSWLVSNTSTYHVIYFLLIEWEWVELIESGTLMWFVTVELSFSESTSKKPHHSSPSHLKKSEKEKKSSNCNFICRTLRQTGIIACPHSFDTTCLAIWNLGIMTYFLPPLSRNLIVKTEHWMSKCIFSWRHGMRYN